jgi:hypothetical protein
LIRAIVDNVDGLTPAMLPEARGGARARDESAPLRVLFLQANDLGATSTSRLFERMAKTCAEIESLHINLRTRPLLRVAGARGYLQGWRMALAWKWVMSRWFAGPLPLDRFDVVLVMRQQRSLALARARRRDPGRTPPFVIDIDATTICSQRSFGIRNDWPPLDAWVGREAFRYASGISCHSLWAADSVRDDYHISPSKVFLFHPTPSVAFTEAAATARDARRASLLRLAAGEPGDPIRIVFVGHDWDRKGGPRLLRWHQERWADRAELHVCSKRAPRDPSCKRVVWHGDVQNDRLVSEILPHMDLLVLPTTNDTSPIALHEAISCGVAQVSSRLAGIPGIVDDGRTGLLAEPRDDAGFIAAIESLLNDPIRIVRMGEASLERSKKSHSASRWFAHLVANLRSAAAGRPMTLMPPASGECGAPEADEMRDQSPPEALRLGAA